MAFGGDGVARSHGKVVFVAGALEGDVVEVALTVDKKSYAKGVVDRLVQPSPFRRPSPCPHSSACGGCSFIEADDGRQRVWKKDFVISSLVKQAGLAKEDLLTMAGAVVADEPLGYRHRVTLKVALYRDSIRLGFMAKQSRKVAAIANCVVATPAIQQVISAVTARLSSSAADLKETDSALVVFDLELQEVYGFAHAKEGLADGKVTGLLRLAEDRSRPARSRGNRQAKGHKGRRSSRWQSRGRPAADYDTMSLAQLQKRWPQLTELVAALGSCEQLIWLGTPAESRKAKPMVYDRHQGIDYLTLPGLFQQAHRSINRRMRAVVYEALKDCGTVLDLFCGSGNLSLGLPDATAVVGVEAQPLSIRAAQQAAAECDAAPADSDRAHSAKGREEGPAEQPLGGSKRVRRYQAASAAEFLSSSLASNRPAFAGIVSDPPRTGHGDTIHDLLALAPQVLVLVGCDPMALARDIGVCLGSGYELKQLHIFDAFPQTFHVETIGVLVPSSRP